MRSKAVRVGLGIIALIVLGSLQSPRKAASTGTDT